MQLVGERQQLPDSVEGVFHKCFMVLVQYAKEDAYERDRLENVPAIVLAQWPALFEPFQFAGMPRDFENCCPLKDRLNTNKKEV